MKYRSHQFIMELIYKYFLKGIALLLFAYTVVFTLPTKLPYTGMSKD